MRLVLHPKVSSSAITIDIHLWIQASIGVWQSWNSVAWSGLGFQCGHQMVGVQMPNLSKRWPCLAVELTTAWKNDRIAADVSSSAKKWGKRHCRTKT